MVLINSRNENHCYPNFRNQASSSLSQPFLNHSQIMANMQNLFFRMMVVVFRWVGVPADPLNIPPLAVTAPAVVSGGAAVPAAAATVSGEDAASAGGGKLHNLVEKQGILLIVLSLLVTFAMQVTINPPGGVWTNDTVLVDLRGNLVLKDGKPIYLGDAAAAMCPHRAMYPHREMYPHRAGYSILARNDPGGYWVYSILNIQIVVSAAFIFGVLVAIKPNHPYLLLVSGLWTCLSATLINLTYVVGALTPPTFTDANTHQHWMHPILIGVTSPIPLMIFGVFWNNRSLFWRYR